jgi:hypothetical protein
MKTIKNKIIKNKKINKGNKNINRKNKKKKTFFSFLFEKGGFDFRRNDAIAEKEKIDLFFFIQIIHITFFKETTRRFNKIGTIGNFVLDL